VITATLTARSDHRVSGLDADREVLIVGRLERQLHLKLPEADLDERRALESGPANVVREPVRHASHSRPPDPGRQAGWHIHRSQPKGDPHPTIGWNTRDTIRVACNDYALAFGWAYNADRRTWTELPSVPRDRAGLTYSTEVWTGDRLLFWANGKVDPSADGLGYRVVPTHIAWSWKPM
jgi:hypothetical protein